MGCLLGAKYTMTATLLHVENNYTEPVVDPTVGQWVESQDPLTGEIVNKWVPGTHNDIPNTVEDETVIGDFKCVARGMSTSNRYGSSETFGKDYVNIDLVRLWIPPTLKIEKSDRVYNIRHNGTTLWVNEDGTPTTFNVNGITPQFGPFNVLVETYVLLERVEESYAPPTTTG